MAALKHTLDYIEQIPVMASQMLTPLSDKEINQPLKPLHSFTELSAAEWDSLVHSVIHNRPLHQKLILTRCAILEKNKVKSKLADLDALD